MATINLKDFYPWYTHDELVEVPDEIAAELLAGKRSDRAYKRRLCYNKVKYSLDTENGMAMAAVICYDDSPERVLYLMERHCRLCRALNSLPEIQGRRIEAHFLHGMSMSEIARAEGVAKSSVSESISRGLRKMRKCLRKFQ